MREKADEEEKNEFLIFISLANFTILAILKMNFPISRHISKTSTIAVIAKPLATTAGKSAYITIVYISYFL